MKKTITQFSIKATLIFLFTLVGNATVNAQTTLSAGDIAFTGYNSNNNGAGLQNDFSFVLLSNISAGTTINFTDNGYKIAGINALSTIEGTLVWTSTTAMARFTQVYIKIGGAGNSVVTISAGSIAGGFSNFILSQAGDQILAYQGSSASPTFISAIHMNSDPAANQAGWDNIASGTSFTSNRSDVPPGLTSGVNCIAPDPNIGTSEKDNGIYNCTGSSGATIANIRAAINTPTNWTIQDVNLFTLAPSCTFSLVAPTITKSGTLSAFSTCAGTASTQQSFTVSGSNLTANLVLTAPTGFEVSTSSGSGYGSSVSLTPSSGTVNSTSIFVRLTSSASGSPSGNVSCASTSATTQNVAASGTVTSTVTPAVSIAITSGSQATCSGSSVTFTATPTNGGGSPTYDFRVNGGSVQNSNSTIYTSTSLLNGQTVTCVMTANNTCQTSPTAISNSIGMSVSGIISLTAAAQTNVSCFGGSNGAASVSPASGGTASYAYNWTPGNPTGDGTTSVTGLSAGTWTCTVTDANGCTANQDFIITEPALLTADSPSDVSVCDSYTLPALTVGNYFTGSNGTGTALTAGDAITTTQTIYVYASNGSCTDENSFVVTINATPSISGTLSAVSCEAGTFTLQATSSAGTINWFEAATGGSSLFTGASFTTPSTYVSMTFYAEVANGSCVNNTRVGVTASRAECTKIQALQCGTTLASNTSAIIANTVTGATNYRFEVSGPNGYLQVVNTTARWFYLSDLPSYELAQTYSVRVKASVNGGSTYSEYGSSCNVTTVFPTTKLQTSQCGAILTNNASAIVANALTGATNYRFEVSGPNGYLQVVNKTVRQLFLSDLPSYEFGQIYSIRVQVSFNNGLAYGSYGSSCNITTTHPITQIQTSQCGGTLASNVSAIIAVSVTGATNYRFEVSGPNGYLQVVNKTVRQLFLSDLPSYESGQTYAVKVQVSLNNGSTYGPYGSSCNITTSHPRTQIQTSQCGATLTSNTTAIAANSVTGVANYRFEVSGPNGYLQVVTKTVRQLFLSDLPSYELGQTYSIRVQLRLTNAAIYGPYGTACNITTASTMPLAPNSNIELKSMNEPTFDFEAFPNPSNGDFTISASEAGTFNIINELGQLVRTVEITEANNNQVKVENMPNGAYFVTGTLNGEAVTKKVIVVR